MSTERRKLWIANAYSVRHIAGMVSVISQSRIVAATSQHESIGDAYVGLVKDRDKKGDSDQWSAPRVDTAEIDGESARMCLGVLLGEYGLGVTDDGMIVRLGADGSAMNECVAIKRTAVSDANKTVPTDELFYIQRTNSWSGDCAVWWRSGAGYTFRLDDAGKYSKSKAMAIEMDRGREVRAWPVAVIDAVTFAGVARCDVSALISSSDGDRKL